MTNDEQWNELLTRLTTKSQTYTVTVLNALREAVPGLRVPHKAIIGTVFFWARGLWDQCSVEVTTKDKSYTWRHDHRNHRVLTLDAIPAELISALRRFTV